MAKLSALPTADQALPGRASPIPTAATHFVSGHALKPPFPAGLEEAVFGLGCFWGVERKFWQTDGVWTTASGAARLAIRPVGWAGRSYHIVQLVVRA